MQQIYCGIDLSLCSPAVAVRTHERIYVYFFQQRQRECNFKYISTELQITSLPPIPASNPNVNLNISNHERYMYISKNIVSAISEHIVISDTYDNITINIEDYAFAGRATSGNSYKLQELGGIVKMSLIKEFPGCTLNSIAISSWKKSVVGFGHAQKIDILKYVDTEYSINLLKLLFFNYNITPKNVPTPVQDIADVICIATAIKIQVPKKTTKKRKRDTIQTIKKKKKNVASVVKYNK